MGTLLFQTSLIAAFVAGVVALFAPCCITFLLPAYLGSVFKEKEKVLFMTLIFGLGIFVVLLPAVLGVAFISRLLFHYHDIIYSFGGGVMIIVAVITLLGIKLPMPHFNQRSQKTDIASIFMLGIFSGITSACCAPVLIGILTFAFLSPNFFGALAVGGMYVLGMVTPLLLISLIMNNKIPNLALLRRPLVAFSLFKKSFLINFGNILGSFIFFVTGFLTIILTVTGVIAENSMEKFTKVIQNAAGMANGYFGGSAILNALFFVIAIVFIVWVIKKA